MSDVPRAQFVEACRRLQRQPLAGEELRRELRGYRKLRFGGENRIVYKYDPETDTVLVVAAGRRRDSEIYALALTRRG